MSTPEVISAAPPESDRADLLRRLEEAEETIRAIRGDQVDAFVVLGDRIYTLTGAERPYRIFVEEMQQGAATLQADGTITYCNRRFAALVRTPQERLVGMRLDAFIAEEDQPACRQLLGTGPGGREAEVQFRSADGVVSPVLLTINPLPEDCGAAIGLLVTDLSIQKQHDRLESLVAERTEELKTSLGRLTRAERLAALGNMAAGLGHDIANIVLPIRARLEVLAREEAPRQHADIQMINDALSHLTNLSAGLRLMALDPARENASVAALDLARWWAETEGVIRCALPRTIELLSQFPPGQSVGIARHQLTQIVFNLAQNAGEALAGHEGGMVTVKAEPLDPSRIAITVSDNGPGIAPDNLVRCFEPYFSTKNRSIATGMGLAMVRGMVESAGGSVSVHSEPDKGATFTLILPASAAEPACAVRPRAALTLSDPRTASLVKATLRAMNVDLIEPEEGAGLEPPDADVWIAQAPASSAIESFIAGGSNRRVLVFGAEGQAAHQRIVHLDSKTPLSALRDAIVVCIEGKRIGQ